MHALLGTYTECGLNKDRKTLEKELQTSMMRSSAHLTGLYVLARFVIAQTVTPTDTERVIPTLSPQVNALPSLTPTIHDDTAPNAQDCPGYQASNVADTDRGFMADLTIAGEHCQAFGNDIDNLILEVQYQSKERL
jgi:alpha-glucosidase